MRDTCLRAAERPDHPPGTPLLTGRYGWCLQKKDARRQFQDDGSGEQDPEFGWVLKEKAIDWEDDNPLYMDGVSMNCLGCAKCEACVVALHPKADQFAHVAIFDLGQLNHELGEGMLVRALYDPDPDPPGIENPCHYVIRPKGRSLEDLAEALRMWSKKLRHHEVPPPRRPGEPPPNFVPPKKPPTRPEQRVQELAEKHAYERVLTIKVKVWPPTPRTLPGDGTQSSAEP